MLTDQSTSHCPSLNPTHTGILSVHLPLLMVLTLEFPPLSQHWSSQYKWKKIDWLGQQLHSLTFKIDSLALKWKQNSWPLRLLYIFYTVIGHFYVPCLMTVFCINLVLMTLFVLLIYYMYSVWRCKADRNTRFRINDTSN